MTVRDRTVKALILTAALLLVGSAPAAAQTVGVGLSFLSDQGGTGLTVDYAKFFRDTAGGRSLDLVGDFSIHHNGWGNDFVGVSGGVTSLFIQGGVRTNGTANEKVRWHAQGLVGLWRASWSWGAAGVNQDICEAFGLDCDLGTSDFGVLLTPGAGIDYALNEQAALRAQLDIPIAIGDNTTTRFWIGLSWMLSQ